MSKTGSDQKSKPCELCGEPAEIHYHCLVSQGILKAWICLGCYAAYKWDAAIALELADRRKMQAMEMLGLSGWKDVSEESASTITAFMLIGKESENEAHPPPH